MKLTIEIKRVCPDCQRVGITSGHGTTVEECERWMGRPCEHPEEHHPARRKHLTLFIQ